MAEEIDVVIRQKTGGKKRLRDSFHAMMSWAEKSGRAFRFEELPRLIGKPVGVDEKEIKAIVDRWLRCLNVGKSFTDLSSDRFQACERLLSLWESFVEGAKLESHKSQA